MPIPGCWGNRTDSLRAEPQPTGISVNFNREGCGIFPGQFWSALTLFPTQPVSPVPQPSKPCTRTGDGMPWHRRLRSLPRAAPPAPGKARRTPPLQKPDLTGLVVSHSKRTEGRTPFSCNGGLPATTPPQCSAPVPRAGIRDPASLGSAQHQTVTLTLREGAFCVFTVNAVQVDGKLKRKGSGAQGLKHGASQLLAKLGRIWPQDPSHRANTPESTTRRGGQKPNSPVTCEPPAWAHAIKRQRRHGKQNVNSRPMKDTGDRVPTPGAANTTPRADRERLSPQPGTKQPHHGIPSLTAFERRTSRAPSAQSKLPVLVPERPRNSTGFGDTRQIYSQEGFGDHADLDT